MKGYPDNSELNKISPDNPVFLVGMVTHASWVFAKSGLSPQCSPSISLWIWDLQKKELVPGV